MSFKQLEEPLKLINKLFVSLDEHEVKETEVLLRKVLWKLVGYMKEDEIFRELFVDFYFGGSFYHNLKIQNPDEFDIDFMLRLPECKHCKISKCNKCRCVDITCGEAPGFLYFKMKKKLFPAFYKKFCKDGFVQNNLIFNWTKSLIYKALKKFETQRRTFPKRSPFRNTVINVYTECPPALKICISSKSRLIYVDLAAAFTLEQTYWPNSESGYRPNPTKKEYFSIVPSSPNESNRYWRPSFQEQEKEIISKKERLKPALRLLKIMKTNLNHTVSSYILKTLIMEESETYEWKNMSLAHTFMLLFKKYIDCLRERRVPYYWNDNINLLDYTKGDTLINHCNEISKLYLKLHREYETNPFVIAEVILKRRSDYNKFIRDWTIMKNHKCSVANREACSDESYFDVIIKYIR